MPRSEQPSSGAPGDYPNRLAHADDEMEWFRSEKDLAAFNILSTPIVIYDPSDGRIRFANHAALDFLDERELDRLFRFDLPCGKDDIGHQLATIAAKISSGDVVQASWEANRNGKIFNVSADHRLVRIDDGHTALLIEMREHNCAEVSDDGVGIGEDQSLLQAELRETRQQVQKLQHQVEFQDTLLNAIPVPIFVRDDNGRFLICNLAMAGMLRKDPADIIGAAIEDVFTGGEAESIRASDRAVIESGVPCHDELSFVDESGEENFRLACNARFTRRFDGAKGIVGALIDITAERRAKIALEDKNVLLETLIEAIPAPVFFKDSQDDLIGCNSAFASLSGSRREDVVGKAIDRERMRVLYETQPIDDTELLQSGGSTICEVGFGDPAGDVRIVLFFKAVFATKMEERAGIVGVGLDVTQQKRIEDELRAKARDLADIVELSTDWFWEMDADLRFTDVSNDPDGTRTGHYLGRRMEEVFSHSLANEPERWQAYFNSVEAGEDLKDFLINEDRDGAPFQCLLISGKARYDDDGRFAGYRGMVADMTEFSNVTATLKNREAQLEEAQKIAKFAVFVHSTSSRKIEYYSGAMGPLLEMTPDELKAWRTSFLNCLDMVDEADRMRVEAVLKTAGDASRSYDITYGIRTKLGTPRVLRQVGQPRFDENGGYKHTIAVVQDVTEARSAEEKLRQMQKMEAIGQLTGGVAHDFNNLLTVIQGGCELLVRSETIDRDYVDMMADAVRRGADLTHRLLAYARQQPLNAVDINLGDLVDAMLAMLARTLGEDIDIKKIVAPDLWSARADPGPVQDVILNLSLNARDAMPDGGVLTIEISNDRLDDNYLTHNPDAVVGDFVVLSVTDSGCGMTEDVQSHATEPFFTTKEVGKGSGLGLSMAYGFAKQSGGYLSIYSEPGKGTTVKLYLPRSQTLTSEHDSDDQSSVPTGRGEHILIIEDDDMVRRVAVRLLNGLNYVPFEAADASLAREVIERGEPIDLILSDVVLPGGLSGPQFAEELRLTHPELTVLFMSGYPAESARRNGFLGSDSVLLNKPFRREELARALRDALESIRKAIE